MWLERGWLSTHFVFVIHVPSIKMFRILLSGTLEGVELAVKGNAELVDLIKVPNRHAAILTKLELLQWVDAWRLELPHSKITKGGTELWRQAGPTVDLRSVWRAVQAEL
ncbi:hypothetical protein ACFV9C_42500 [Kribbella sp. NPDC059898]|uniref:hypothetical protein n=1 Tax=Kribbella sp. NPDC059898 TaxID=3346995 RepID=UPI00365035E7